MKRSRTPRRSRGVPHLDLLTQLAEDYARSSSRLEDKFWEIRLDNAINQLIEERDEETLNASLDQLYGSNARAYDALADTIESHCESGQLDDYDIQLIALPILAWSRFSIPASTIPASVLDVVRSQLQAHILAANAKLALANHLFSPDQLPQGFCPTAELMRALGQYALQDKTLKLDPSTLPESMTFLADSRYVVGVVAVPHGTEVFRWQEADGTRLAAERAWQQQGAAALRPLLTGCVAEFLLPQSYFTACREADRTSRPFSLAASIDYLKTTLNVEANDLRAVIAPFHDEELEEYRIGFTLCESNDVLYGLVWPLLEAEDYSSDLVPQIEALLQAGGIEEVITIEHRFPMEYCEDCGNPLYPNPDGEPVHAEMPEDRADPVQKHLH